MIRFVDIRNQGTGYRFSFWDTVRDEFLEFGGSQAWDTLDDFIESFNTASTHLYGDIERFLSLIPVWAANNREQFKEFL